MSKKIEVYSDGSARGTQIIECVKKLACPKCEIVVHDGDKAAEGRYAPSVWMDGKAIDVDKLLKK